MERYVTMGKKIFDQEEQIFMDIEHNPEEDNRVGEYQIPSHYVCKYKSELMEGKHSARRTFYQNIAPYAPQDVLSVRHAWKRNCCEYYAGELLDELTEYQIYHEMDYTITSSIANVVQLMKEYGYLNDDEDEV